MRAGDKLLKDVFNSSYLGSDFQANGGHSHAMGLRVAQAKGCPGSMWPWQLDLANLEPRRGAGAPSSLKGIRWCARCLCRITGRGVADECRHPTIDRSAQEARPRVRRLRWAAHMLRLGVAHLVEEALLARAERFSGGGYPADRGMRGMRCRLGHCDQRGLDVHQRGHCDHFGTRLCNTQCLTPIQQVPNR